MYRLSFQLILDLKILFYVIFFIILLNKKSRYHLHFCWVFLLLNLSLIQREILFSFHVKKQNNLNKQQVTEYSDQKYSIFSRKTSFHRFSYSFQLFCCAEGNINQKLPLFDLRNNTITFLDKLFPFL